MSAPILATKLHIPSPRPNLVLRPRLVERLNEGLHRKLTLISAPAGFGKTTLATAWVAGCGRRAAWLSLDEADSDPARLVAYLVAAVRTIGEHAGAGVLGMLQSPQSPPTNVILTALLNDMATIRDPFVFVLDDYHLIHATPSEKALACLLEHLPPQMHLVITTREEPNLPLARLRVRDQLTELRATDLRFTHAEASTFLNLSMGLNLTAADIAALETRTEGWIAGLQLAAIAMHGNTDAAGFIKSFTGSHHLVMDYLVEELLQQQSEPVQTFLLRTSILDRLCPALCSAVLRTPPSAGQKTLAYLERANLLVVPLDDRREWYRYHHLLADALQARLNREQPQEVADLHLRACDWYEQHSFRPDAIRHALAAGDFERAADLIERERSARTGSYFSSQTWLGWVKALPDEVVRKRPRLSIGFAWELLFRGEMEAAEARMKDAHRLLAEIADRPESEADLRPLRVSLAIAAAFHAQSLGDADGTVSHARRAMTLITEDDDFARGLARGLLGLASLRSGDLEIAYTFMADGMGSMRKAGHPMFAASGTHVLADIQIAQGRLFDAARIYEEALQLVTAQGQPVLQGTVELHMGLSALYAEWGDLDTAREHLRRGQEIGERGALNWPYSLYRAQARMKEADGDLEGALQLLEAAEPLFCRSPVPDVHPAAALKARVWIAQGRLNDALGWARKQNLSAHDRLSYLRECEHLTLARALIACYKNGRGASVLQEASELLERLLQAAEAGGRFGSVIEILVLQALACEAQGNIAMALTPLARALTLAEPEGYVRVFASEGAPVAALLRRMKDTGWADLPEAVREYVNRLLGALAEGSAVPPATPAPWPIVEPLSPRELEVLELIARGCSNQQISERLFVALSTVKGHILRIFGKLQVQRRTEAVARARALGLLRPER